MIVRHEAVTAGTNMIVFWYVTPCTLFRKWQRFGGTYSLHFWSVSVVTSALSSKTHCVMFQKSVVIWLRAD